jgi:hypothetical protein
MANVNNFVDGTYNLGTDVSVRVIDNDTNAPISLAGRLVSFKADPKITYVNSTPVDNGGFVQHRSVPQGWTGTIRIDRAQGDLDSLQAFKEQLFYTQGREKYFTIVHETRNQNNNQTDRYAYLFSAMNMDTSGEYKAADKVEITLTFHAQQRVPA